MTEFGPPPDMTDDDLVEAVRRNMDPFWIQALLDDPTSSSIFIGWTAPTLRIQDAGDTNVDIGSYILTAPGARQATSTVTIQRPSGAMVTFTNAQRFRDERGMTWRVSGTVVVPASGGTQTITLPVITERSGYFLNSFLPLSYQFFDAPPDLNFIILPGADPAVGGKSPFLDLHGSERAVLRAPGETDLQYSQRMVLIPDQVSPHAISDSVTQVLGGFTSTAEIANLIHNYGLRTVIEPFEDGAQPNELGLGGQIGFYCDSGNFCDDPFGPTIRDLRNAIAAFEVRLPTISDVAAVAALADMLDTKRAAGVSVLMVFGEEMRMDRHPATLVGAGTWTGVGGTDMVADLATYDGDTSYVVTTTGAGASASKQPGDVTYQVPAIPAPFSVSYVVIRGWAKRVSTGGAAPSLAFVYSSVRVLGISVFQVSVINTDWQEFICIMELNPVTGLPWSIADVTSPVTIGIANTAVGATDPLWVSELRLEQFVSYG